MDEKILEVVTLKTPLDITLGWSTPVDLDLCVFYRTPAGDTGGVFSDEFRQDVADLGTLDAFPHMLHHGDVGTPAGRQLSSEQVTVGRPANFDRIDIVAINYDDAIDMLDVDYSDPQGYCRLQTAYGSMQIPAAPVGNGHVYHVATLARRADGDFDINVVNRTITLTEAYHGIPGFELICE